MGAIQKLLIELRVRIHLHHARRHLLRARRFDEVGFAAHRPMILYDLAKCHDHMDRAKALEIRK